MGDVVQPPWVKLYLSSYNLLMFLGFSYTLSTMSYNYYLDQESFPTECWDSVGKVFQVLQVLMYLEVINPILGVTKGSPLVPFIQVTGRNIWIFLLIGGEPRMQGQAVVFYLFMAYSVIEIVRYPYYLLGVHSVHAPLVTWLRYTLWVPLFPIGFLCEAIIAYRDISFFEETGQFSMLLPNSWNMGFYFPHVIRFYLLLGCFPMLCNQMTHMYRLRTAKMATSNPQKAAFKLQ